jgi:hypothetical protein
MRPLEQRFALAAQGGNHGIVTTQEQKRPRQRVLRRSFVATLEQNSCALELVLHDTG